MPFPQHSMMIAYDIDIPSIRAWFLRATSFLYITYMYFDVNAYQNSDAKYFVSVSAVSPVFKSTFYEGNCTRDLKIEV